LRFGLKIALFFIIGTCRDQTVQREFSASEIFGGFEALDEA